MAENAARLRDQVEAAGPRLIVSLGNAAARVIAALSECQGPGRLTAETYGASNMINVAGATATWIAAVHLATPQVWQVRHREWLAGGGFSKLT